MSAQSRPRRTPGELFFFFALAAAIVFKFWLIQSEEIFGFNAEYDALWYLRSASNWYWKAPYGWQAFFRPAGYPLFIALSHWVGAPLRLSIELFQIAAYLLLARALRSLRCPRWLCFAVFVICTLNPCSFQLNNLALSDTAYSAGFTMLVASMILTSTRRRPASALLAGVSFAFAWTSREETFLLLPLLLVFFWFLIAGAPGGHGGFTAALLRSSSLLATFLLVAFGLIGTVYLLNWRTFGSFSNSNITAHHFEAAYRALTRIKPPRVLRYVPVTHEALQMAYKASPTFARLEPLLEGAVGAHWKEITAKRFGYQQEIGGAWWRFALGDAANHAGVYANPASEREFFSTVARELNRACDQQRLPSRYVFSTYFDPGALAFLSQLPNSFDRVASVLLKRYTMTQGRADDALPAERRRLYERMCLPRASLTSTAEVIARLAWMDPSDPVVAASYEMNRRTDVPGAIRTGQSSEVTVWPRAGRVELEIALHTYHRGPPSGRLLFSTASGTVVSVGPPLMKKINDDHFASPLPPALRLISLGCRSSYNPKSFAAENWIGRYYPVALDLLLAMSIPGIIGTFVHLRRARSLSPLLAALTLLFVALAGRVALLTYMDANYYDLPEPRFSFPIMGLCWTLLALLAYHGLKQLWKEVSSFRRRVPLRHANA